MCVMFFEGKVTIYIPGTIPDVAKGDVFEDSVGSVHAASASSSDRKIPTGLCVFNIGEKGRMVKETVASAAPKLNSKPPPPSLSGCKRHLPLLASRMLSNCLSQSQGQHLECKTRHL